MFWKGGRICDAVLLFEIKNIFLSRKQAKNVTGTTPSYIKHERPCLNTFPNNDKRVENATGSGVLLTIFCMLGNVV